MTTDKNTQAMSALHRAADEGNVEQVRALLQQGARTDEENAQKQLPLYCALNLNTMDEGDEQERREAIFRLLWEANPAAGLHVDAEGETVLHRMARYGFEALTREVLAEQPRLVTFANHLGEYPIHRAVLSNQFGVAEALFQVEGVSRQLNYKKASALHLAAAGKPLEMVKLCCEQSPEMLNAKDRFRNTPFALAERFNAPEVKDYLQAQPGVNTVIDTSAITKIG